MPQFAPAYGTYDYSTVGGIHVTDIEDPVLVKPRFADTPGFPGQYSAGGLLATRKINVVGMIVRIDGTIRDVWEAFKAAHAPGVIKPFYLYADRFCYAEVTGISNTKWSGSANFQVDFNVELSASDPYLYSTGTQTHSGLAGGGTIAVTGTALAAPTWTLVVSSIGTAGTITIANTTTGETLVLTPTATGTFVIDSRAESITKSGVNASGQMAGTFLHLAPGSNTITVTTGGSAAVSSLSVEWQERFI